ncbi:MULTISPECIES: septum formation initiator family protein [unclassified Nocardiopsis]|uniref:FtsB family cell division protein n=1 Tax=unclassified Nocardiopsis TaxID=2649073 RepID=UPI001358439D|nr:MULTISPECIES: septum formation initiator family protein [unclassified Nocardiopsis]
MLTSRAAILALVVCVIALSLAYPLREYVAQRAQIAELRQERERMEESVGRLRQREEELSRDSYVEREARARLHYQYPDEIAYIVIRPDAEGDAEDEDGPRQPWFLTLWRSVQEADSPPPGDGL